MKKKIVALSFVGAAVLGGLAIAGASDAHADDYGVSNSSWGDTHNSNIGIKPFSGRTSGDSNFTNPGWDRY